jgi:META domain
MMLLCRHAMCFLVFVTAAFALSPALAGDPFPFGSELMLDAAPMHGSKRIPMLEIEDDGSASIDLWCTSLHGRATVTADSIAIVPGAVATDEPAPPCDADHAASDAALLAELAQVTTWRRDGDRIDLSGTAAAAGSGAPTGTIPLHYRLMTN